MALQKNCFELGGSNRSISQQAINFAREDLAAEEAARGWLPPSRIVSPLANGGYSKEEYANMERDRGKYVMYAAAIREAVHDLIINRQNNKVGGTKNPISLRALVPGCGRGRLVQFILDAVNIVQAEPIAQPIDLSIWAVDVNPIAISHCRQRFHNHRNVFVVGPVALVPGMKESDLPLELNGVTNGSPLHCCDLIVSELLGSFADNEFMTAVTETIRRLFLNMDETAPHTIMIPEEFATFVAPMSCPRATTLMNSISRPLDAPYNMSLTDDVVIWSEGLSETLWSGKCYESKHEFSGEVLVDLIDPKMASPISSINCRNVVEGDVIIDGLVGFFTSKLYGDLMLDTRPQLYPMLKNDEESITSRHQGRNSMHWEAFYFPFPTSLTLKKHSQLRLKVSQFSSTSPNILCSDNGGGPYLPQEMDEMWFEWAVLVKEVSNSEGCELMRNNDKEHCVVKVDAKEYAITLGSHAVPPPSTTSGVSCEKEQEEEGEESKLKYAKIMGNASA